MKKLFDNKIFRLIVGLVKTFIILVMICYVGFVILQRITGNKSIMGYRFFTVATGSMKGVYNINDVIAVKDYDSNQLKVGDDIAYLGQRAGLEGKIIVHRLVKIEEGSDGGRVFTTKGVNSNVEDPVILDDQILGKVTGKVPIISEINHLVRSQLGFFSLIFCPLVVIIVLEILQTITDYQLEKNQIQEIEKEK
jgi:signal peptidase